jgi:hypothetical protein
MFRSTPTVGAMVRKASSFCRTPTVYTGRSGIRRARVDAASRERGTALKHETRTASMPPSSARLSGPGHRGSMISTSQPASLSCWTAASVPGKRTFPYLLRTSSVGTVISRSFGMGGRVDSVLASPPGKPHVESPAVRVTTVHARYSCNRPRRCVD